MSGGGRAGVDSERFALHVMVPAYGPSPYLERTLASVLQSADARTTVTVVDDGSPGPEVETVVHRAGRGIEYVRDDLNRGVAGAFRSCLRLSRGEYTVFLGSDDIVEPCYVAEVRRLAGRYAMPAMVLPGVTVIGSAGEPAMPLGDRVKRWLAPAQEQLLAGDRLAASLLTGNWLYFPAVAWRTEVLRRYGFRQDMQTALDLDVELRMVFDGEALAWSPRPAFRYRRHEQSASSTTARSGDRFAEERQVFRWAHERAQDLGWRRSALAARVHPTARLHWALARLAGMAVGRSPA